MRLRNKKTGEIVDLSVGLIKDTYSGKFIQIKPVAISNKEGYLYETLAGLNEEWEDAPEEEPKGSALDLTILTLTNFIENEPDEDMVDLEDCKQLLEKLKAWRRLKDKGFTFEGWYWNAQCIEYNINYADLTEKQIKEADKDLDLLFGGKE